MRKGKMIKGSMNVSKVVQCKMIVVQKSKANKKKGSADDRTNNLCFKNEMHF